MRSLSFQGAWLSKFFPGGTPHPHTPHLLIASLSSRTNGSPLVNTYIQSGHSKVAALCLCPSPARPVPASPTRNEYDWPSYILAPGPRRWVVLSKGWWGPCPSAGFPGNQWANLMPIPLKLVTSPSPYSPSKDCCSVLPAMGHMVGSLQDPSQTCKHFHWIIHWCLSCWLWALPSSIWASAGLIGVQPNNTVSISPTFVLLTLCPLLRMFISRFL